MKHFKNLKILFLLLLLIIGTISSHIAKPIDTSISICEINDKHSNTL